MEWLEEGDGESRHDTTMRRPFQARAWGEGWDVLGGRVTWKWQRNQTMPRIPPRILSGKRVKDG